MGCTQPNFEPRHLRRLWPDGGSIVLKTHTLQSTEKKLTVSTFDRKKQPPYLGVSDKEICEIEEYDRQTFDRLKM